MLTARALAVRGHAVLAAMRAPDTRNSEGAADLRHWAGQNDADLTVVDMDVTDDMSVGRAVGAAVADGPIDVLINNAGVMPVGVTEAFTVDQLPRILRCELVRGCPDNAGGSAVDAGKRQRSPDTSKLRRGPPFDTFLRGLLRDQVGA